MTTGAVGAKTVDTKALDMKAVLAKAMRDPEIAKSFGSPKLAPITKKIMSDPSCLENPMEYFKEELAADDELAAMAAKLLPKLKQIIESQPAAKEKIPAKSPSNSPPKATPSSDTTPTASSSTNTSPTDKSAYDKTSTSPKRIDRTVVGRSTAQRKKKIIFQPSKPVAVTILSGSSLHHATLESAKEVFARISFNDSETFETSPAKESTKKHESMEGRHVTFSSDHNNSHTFLLPSSPPQLSSLLKTTVKVTLLRRSPRDKSSEDAAIIGEATMALSEIDFDAEDGITEVELEKEKDGKVKKGRGIVKCRFVYDDQEGKRDTVEVVATSQSEKMTTPRPKPSSPTTSPTSASPKTTPSSPPDFALVMKRAMKDPKIAKAFADPKLAPITKKIMRDPSCLANPMEYFKEELAADEGLAALAAKLLPKLGDLTKTRSIEEANSPYSSPGGSRTSSRTSSPQNGNDKNNGSKDQKNGDSSDEIVVSNMFKNQHDLPRLPLPSLEDTCELFLEVASTVVNEDKFKKTRSAVTSFLSTAGPELHKQLVDIDNHPDNKELSWFHNFHDDMYMEARFPTYIYKNPAGVMSSAAFEQAGIEGQVDRASHIIAATLKYVEKIVEETLEPDEFKSFPLDMLQYKRLVASNRIPRKNRDEFVVHPDPKEVKHIVVTRGRAFYKVAVIGEDGEHLSIEKIKNGLRRIVNKAEEDGDAAKAVGALTTCDRDIWAGEREKLISIADVNEKSLASIDTALFMICLDPPTDAPETLETSMRAAMHGNPSYRWFDKPVQLIVTGKGNLCSNAEHSWGDGIVMARWGEELKKEIENPTYRMNGGESCKVERLTWQTDAEVDDVITSALEDANKLASTWRVTRQTYQGFGSNFVKAAGFSPDAVLQQVFQLAYRKCHGISVSQYCVAATMAFKAGRNDRVRSNTPKSKEFIDAVVEGGREEELRGLLKEAAERHSALSRGASMGFGCDRHLYCLYKLAERAGEVPEIFKDEAFTTLMTDTLCTTNLNIPFIEAMMVNPAFSDFTNDGDGKKEGDDLPKYMVPYSTFGDEIKFIVCGFKPCDVEKFQDAIFESLDEIKSIIGNAEKDTKPAKATNEPAVEKAGSAGNKKVDMKKIMAQAMKDPEIAKAFGNPKLAPITKKILSDPSCLVDPMKYFKEELAADKELAAMAVKLLPKLTKLMPQSLPPRTTSPSAKSESDASSESILESRQTIQKKKKQRVRKPKSTPTSADSDTNTNPNVDDLSSRASSPAFSEAYLQEKESEAMEEEITRAIAIANRTGDLEDLTKLTSLFGEGTLVELRATAPEARKYIEMVNKRDEMKIKFATEDTLYQSTAASPTRKKKSAGLGREVAENQQSDANSKSTSPLGAKKPKSKIYINADGTPFSKAQIQSSKRRVAAKLKKLSPPQAAITIQLIFRGKTSRDKTRRLHRSATKIQSLVLGWLTRKTTSKDRKRYKDALKEESVRNRRARRIAEQRAELALLRRTPASRLIDVDNRRQNLSVRKIQRFFREIAKRGWFVKKRKAEAKKASYRSVVRATKKKTPPVSSSQNLDEYNLTVKVDDASDNEEEAENDAIEMSNASFWGEQSVLTSKDTGFNAKHRSFAPEDSMDDFTTPIKHKDSILRRDHVIHTNQASALRLADLQRRVMAASYEHKRLKEKKEREAAANLNGKNARSHGGARRGYEKLFELQNTVTNMLGERSQKEQSLMEAEERRKRRLNRFRRLCSSLESPPTLSSVDKQKSLRDNKGENKLKELLSGYKLPRSQKAIERSKRAHQQTLNAMEKSGEWWSVNLENQLGGGTVDLRHVAPDVNAFDEWKEGKEKGNPTVDRYNDDEASLFWYAKCVAGREEEKLGKKGVQVKEELFRRTRLTGEAKSAILDAECNNVEKRKSMLTLNIHKVFARHQRLIAAPEALKAMKDGREGRVNDAAVKLQSQFRGIRDRREVGKKLSQSRVAGALQLLVNELSGNGGNNRADKNVSDVAGVLGGLLGVSSNVTTTATTTNPPAEKYETRSLFGSTVKKPPRHTQSTIASASASASASATATNLVSNTRKTTNLANESKFTTPNASPVKHRTATTSTPNLTVQTRDPDLAPTPLMRGMLVDVDLGLGAADKPKVWTPARILSINPSGDCTVEFDKDGNTMSGILQNRVRMRAVPMLTPSTAVLERRQMREEKDNSYTPMTYSEAKISSSNTLSTSIMTVDTPEYKDTPMNIATNEKKMMSRENSYRSVLTTDNKPMLDDSAVMQALNHADLAEAALSPGPNSRSKRKIRPSDDSLFSSGKVDVPVLNMELIGSEEKEGYVSPPSVSPARNMNAIDKIKQQAKVMKQQRLKTIGSGRYTHNNSLLHLNFSDYVNSARVRSFISKCVDEVANSNGLVGDHVDEMLRNKSLFGIFEHLVNGDSEGEIVIEDVRDVFRCLMAELELSVDSFGDIHSCAVSLALFLSGADENEEGERSDRILLKDLKEFICDCNSHPANVRAIALHIGRKLEIAGGKLGISGGEMLRRVFGDVGMVDIDKFKKGLSSLKPKLMGGVEDVDDLITFLRLGGGGHDGDFISINKLEQVGLPATEGSHKRLQGIVRHHFENDDKLVKSFVLLCKDMDFDDSGGLSWQAFCKVLDSSTLLLTLSQTCQLCTLLTRDIGSAEGKGIVNYMEIKRIAKGEVLTMPRINRNFEPAKMLNRSKSEGSSGSLGTNSNSSSAATSGGGTKSLSDLKSSRSKPRLLGSSSGAPGRENISDSANNSIASGGSNSRKGSTGGGKTLSSLKKAKRDTAEGREEMHLAAVTTSALSTPSVAGGGKNKDRDERDKLSVSFKFSPPKM